MMVRSTGWRCAAAAMALAVWGLGCHRNARPSLLLITIDTLRADHVGAYGSGRVKTPALDALAAAGIRFNSAYATAPLTLPSHVSMLSGLPPAAHTVRTNDGFRVPAGVPLVADRLRESGYKTAAFVGAAVLRRETGLARGFDMFDDDLNGRAERRAEDVATRALAWIGTTGSPAFVWIHLYDPHLPYDPPAPHARPNRLYEGEIEYVDGVVSTVIARATDHFGDRLAVVVAADHGEGLGDHGEVSHGALLYESTVRVPLIVRLPEGRRAGTVEDRPVSVSGIAGALLELADLPSRMAPSVLEPQENEPTVMETLYLRQQLGWSPLYAARSGDIKVIDAPDPELYNLERDHAEHQNAAAAHAGDLDRLRSRLRRELAAAAASAAEPERADADPARSQQLASLGYVTGGGGHTRGVEPPGGVNPAARISVWVDVEAGLEQAQAGRKDAAAAIFERVRARDPENVLAMKFLGALALERGDAARAIALNEAVLATGLHKADAKKNLVIAYHQAGAESARSGRTAAAIAQYEKLVALAPHDLDAHERLGALLHRAGRIVEARARFEQVLQADPQRRAPALSLAIIELEADNVDEAIKLLEPITEGWPGAPTARAYLEDARQRAGRRR